MRLRRDQSGEPAERVIAGSRAGAGTVVTIAENSLRRSPNNETVLALLAALDSLHRELDPALDEISVVLKAYPSGVPTRPK